MQITGVGNGENLVQSLTQFKVGQRLLVQVLGIGDQGYGKVLLNGREFTAKLEISAWPGQQFWGLVREISQNEVLLVKQYPGETQQTEGAGPVNTPSPITGRDPELELLAANLPESSETLSHMLGNLSDEPEKSFIWPDYRREIPQWPALEKAGAAPILLFLKKLGLNYEQRFLQAGKLPDALREKEFAALKDTLKGRILSALGQRLSEPEQAQLKKVLHSLTEQQLWLQKDAGDNIFVLLSLPLHDAGQVYEVRIAAEGPRKGSKLDREHYHIGILAETPVLGELGAESWIHEGQISIKIFSGQEEVLRPLAAAIFPQTRDSFAKLGFSLQGIEFADWEQAGFFRRFLDGKSQSGVDILR